MEPTINFCFVNKGKLSLGKQSQVAICMMQSQSSTKDTAIIVSEQCVWRLARRHTTTATSTAKQNQKYR